MGTSQSTSPDLTAKELADLKQLLARLGASPGVRLKASDGDDPKIITDHADPHIGLALLMKAVGTADPDFVHGLISQLCSINSEGGEINFCHLNFMLAIVKGVEPRDELAAMLAAQMAVVHDATIMAGKRLLDSRSILELDSAERVFTKLTHTFAIQMETLKRYRAGETHTDQNVCVSEGGQAIVANVTHPPGETAPQQTVASAPAVAKTNVVPLPLRSENKDRITAPDHRRKPMRRVMLAKRNEK
jgi:hypothetical protein